MLVLNRAERYMDKVPLSILTCAIDLLQDVNIRSVHTLCDHAGEQKEQKVNVAFEGKEEGFKMFPVGGTSLLFH